MGRSERFTETAEIKKEFPCFLDRSRTGGPILYYENGRKYYDDSEAHILVDGKTGFGKSACVSLGYVCSCIQAGESILAVDPKGDIYQKTCYLAEETHRVFCLDFRKPRLSPTRWNPLRAMLELYRSPDPDDRDIAGSQISELAQGIYPVEDHMDRFWPHAAADYFCGLVYALFDLGKDEEINMDSIYRMMEASEERIANTTMIKELSESLPEDSMARRYLASYISSPNETRASIHAVAAEGLAKFGRSRGLMEMLGNDNLDMNALDLQEKPLAMYLIIPDETSAYDCLAGILISQVAQHFIRLAHDKYHGRLPGRLNLILEELSSLGRSLGCLPNLMAAGRSRNIRIMMVLQNGNSQLKEIYGANRAAAINACVGITYAFASNSWETLQEWSLRCGKRQVEYDGHMTEEDLITPSQLAAMPVGTALVLVNNQYKYVTRFPFLEEMFDMSGWHPPVQALEMQKPKEGIFQMIEYVTKYRDMRISELLGTVSEKPWTVQERIPAQEYQRVQACPDGLLDTETLIRKINARLAELELEENGE